MDQPADAGAVTCDLIEEWASGPPATRNRPARERPRANGPNPSTNSYGGSDATGASCRASTATAWRKSRARTSSDLRKRGKRAMGAPGRHGNDASPTARRLHGYCNTPTTRRNGYTTPANP